MHEISLPNGGVVHICSMPAAASIYSQYDRIISLIDPDFKDVPFRGENHCVFRVDDTEHPTPRHRLLTMGDLEFILKPVEPGQKVLVHCHAGVSRSTAIGIMLAKISGASNEAIRDGIVWVQADPNLFILSWSACFCGEDMVPLVREWIRTLRYRSCDAV